MKKKLLLAVTCCMFMGIAGCGMENDSAGSSGITYDTGVSYGSVEVSGDNLTISISTSQDDNAASNRITDEQALEAIKNYLLSNDPDLEQMFDSEDYTIYFDVYKSDTGETVVLYRSYTGAQIRYYVNTYSGDTYVTELVPGIIDEEQLTDETLNVKKYMN